MRTHLRLVDSPPPGEPETAAPKRTLDWARPLVVGLGVLAAGLFGASFFQNWWRFWLYAPQYPKGLKLDIALTGMGGDVHEIDLLNHYIGMRHLAEAAPLERELAGYGVALIAVLVLAMLAVSGRKVNRLIMIPALAFPVGFLADSFYWLYTFGHNLDPKAPLRIGAFTPEMFGNGKIGQFETFAQPALGFWLAVAGVACVVAATVLRSKICQGCARAGACKLVCPRSIALPPAPAKQ